MITVIVKCIQFNKDSHRDSDDLQCEMQNQMGLQDVLITWH